MCTNQDISNIPFILRGNHVLVHGHKKDLPHITCIFYLFKYVVNNFLVSAIFHHISLVRLLPQSYFKISTFQPNFLCSSSFKHGFCMKLMFDVKCSISGVKCSTVKTFLFTGHLILCISWEGQSTNLRSQRVILNKI